jgi:hypothetical protein
VVSPMGPVASMLTARPPRAASYVDSFIIRNPLHNVDVSLLTEQVSAMSLLLQMLFPVISNLHNFTQQGYVVYNFLHLLNTFFII